MIGTRIVLSGYNRIGVGSTSGYTTNGSSGVAVVELPQALPGNWSSTFDEGTGASGTVPGAVSDYAVFTTPFGSGVATVTAMSTTSGVQSFTVTGTNTNWFFWQVVRISNASVAGGPGVLG